MVTAETLIKVNKMIQEYEENDTVELNKVFDFLDAAITLLKTVSDEENER